MGGFGVDNPPMNRSVWSADGDRLSQRKLFRTKFCDSLKA